ncbi:uncharacterized protein LOC134862734 isoform X2 [Eleginops maclovinus]|uniref:uncharacterized protein LOC134862734 isoform X2 n=1 Tax=Eleginops maclovinus TaxID=56733 RepID=UPI003080C34C
MLFLLRKAMLSAGSLLLLLQLSGVQGLCAPEGSSVDLLCSPHSPSMRWFTVRLDGPYHQEEVSADGERVTVSESAERNLTLSIRELRGSDANTYCCKEPAESPAVCQGNSTQLQVAELQVLVLPGSEVRTVSLTCNSSCALRVQPGGFLWFRNSELLRHNFGPWNQQLLSGGEAASYSCAVRGHPQLRAPPVSVDSVTERCFTVTYAYGRMCSSNQKPEDQPCSITYPTELHIQISEVENMFTLTCSGSCPDATPPPVSWFWDREISPECESQTLTVYGLSSQSLSCAVKGHQDLQSEEVCVEKSSDCLSVNYVRRRLCVLEGSSVNISSEYSKMLLFHKSHWIKVRGSEDPETLSEAAGRLEVYDDMESKNVLRIHNLTKNDSAEYMLSFKGDYENWGNEWGVTLVVTGLEVHFSPSAEVKAFQRVSLSCSSSCPLTNNTNYIWFFNGQPLTPNQNQNKHLLLDPVSSQHAGNYCCAVRSNVNIRSAEETLSVIALTSIAAVNVMKLILLFVILPAVFLLHLISRKKKSVAAEPRDVQSGTMDALHESIPLRTVRQTQQQRDD